MQRDDTKAFQAAIDDAAGLSVVPTDARHEKGCVYRYGAVGEGSREYIDHPERCPCHAHNIRLEQP